MLLGTRTPSAKTASRGRVDRRSHIALQDRPLPSELDDGIGDRNRRQEGRRVGMPRSSVELAPARDLPDLPEIHRGDAAGDLLYYRQLGRVERIRSGKLRLQPLEQFDDRR